MRLRARIATPLAVDVWDGLRTQPGRAGLSILAVAVGIAALTVLVAVLGGLRDKARRIAQELGVNVVGILPAGGSAPAAAGRLEERHAAILAANLPGGLVSTMRRYDVPTLGTEKTLSVVATDPALIRIRGWRLQDGRFLDARDMERREWSAVVGRALAERWNWKVGNLIMLRNMPFRIVGIVEAGGGTLETETGDPGLVLGERIVFVPKTVQPYWLTEWKTPEDRLDAIFLRMPEAMDYGRALSTARRLLDQPDASAKRVSWVTPETLTRSVRRLEKTISLTVGSIAVLCLVLGGTTLMSLMVSNVRDRITEIGLRRALGATQKDVAALFVLESAVLTATAALIGVLAAHALLILGRTALPVPIRPGLSSILVPLIAAVVLGIAFSYWPARMAARIAPAEALRAE
jgi:putative ABC transport system permease protein